MFSIVLSVSFSLSLPICSPLSRFGVCFLSSLYSLSPIRSGWRLCSWNRLRFFVCLSSSSQSSLMRACLPCMPLSLHTNNRTSGSRRYLHSPLSSYVLTVYRRVLLKRRSWSSVEETFVIGFTRLFFITVYI